MASTSDSVFATDEGEFCTECGTILPLPDGVRTTVACRRCGHTISCTVFSGTRMVTKVSFNAPKENEDKVATEEVEKKQPAANLADRTCAKCGQEGMTFYTMQTRSVDEGQTVFYQCPKCGAQEMEHS